jgi:AraC family transcriptional regulator
MPTNTTAAPKRQSIGSFDSALGDARSGHPCVTESNLTATVRHPDVASPSIADPTVFEQHLTVTPAGAVRQDVFGTPVMAAALVRGVDRVRFVARLRSRFHTLIAYERGSRVDGKTSIEGLPPSSIRDMTRKLVFIPAGTDLSDEHTPRTNLSAIYFHFTPDILARQPGHCAVDPLAPLLFFENGSLWALMQKLRDILEHAAFDTPYFEALGNLLVLEIARARAPQESARGGLAPWQRRVVTSYIDQHLTDTIPLATLAGLARLSRSHFCRAFKRSFGMSPHRYHANCRIERAKRMLLERGESITNIGLDLGFGQASSFCTTFRKITGTTPSGFQRSAEECELELAG